MNGYLLDTSTCIFLLRGKRSVEEKLNEIDEAAHYLVFCIISTIMGHPTYICK